MLFHVLTGWKDLPSQMDAGGQSSRATITALAVASLLVQLGDSNILYVKKGSSSELLCPCPSCFGTQAVSWYFVQQGKTTLLFHKSTNSYIKRFPAAWNRLEMLQNYSLRFNNVVDNDTGRYWCDLNYFYDMVVVTGTQQKLAHNQANSVCYVLSCSVPSKELNRDVVTWWEGAKQFLEDEEKGRSSIFKGQRASQLHICLKKEALKNKTRERQVKCRFAQETEISFRLMDNDHDFCTCNSLLPFSKATGKDGLQSQCSEIRGNGGPWIPLAICIILQFLIILTLAILWRRSCSQKYPDHFEKPSKDVPMLESTPQIYENIGS